MPNLPKGPGAWRRRGRPRLEQGMLVLWLEVTLRESGVLEGAWGTQYKAFQFKASDDRGVSQPSDGGRGVSARTGGGAPAARAPGPGPEKSWRRIQERRPWSDPEGRRGGRCRYQGTGGLIQAQRTRRAGLERKRKRDISPQTPCFLCDSRAELPDSANGGGLQAEGPHPPRPLLAAPLPASPVGKRPPTPAPGLIWMAAFRSPVKSSFGGNRRSCGSKPTPGRRVPKRERRHAVETPRRANTQRPQLVGLGALLPLGTAVGRLQGQVKPSWDPARLQLAPEDG
ncbi:unnamed protein product [Rangifer tarandus platyrhynchus]|uniref:Uncharacterized protein n=1 Tax=Rangifer tarandus platyrhynchus TaxID=3082113 RepID=A0ABN8ZY75_RANTA|nr:unnamed protein product [Rangifer tarandus platyrhynchus]